MKYSIIIPTLNEELYIGRILGCLVSQKFKDFEVIVVDASSKDKTVEIARGFEKVLDLRVENCPQTGVTYQRNYGAKLAKTDNLVFMDADGFVNSSFFKKVDDYLGSHDVDLLTIWVSVISDNLLDRGMMFVYNAFYVNAVKHWKPSASGAFMYMKRKVFDDVGGFDESIVIAEEFDFARKALKKGYKFKFIRNPSVKTSARRIEKEGRFNYITNMVRNAVLYHLAGPVRNTEVSKYIMKGGSWYVEEDESEEGIKDKIKRLRLKITPKIFKKFKF